MFLKVYDTEGTVGLLNVGESMLQGELEYRKGNYEAAFSFLREAVRRDISLIYDEPWGWMVNARHALGALLLEQGHHSEAAQVFRDDLAMFPNNQWVCRLPSRDREVLLRPRLSLSLSPSLFVFFQNVFHFHPFFSFSQCYHLFFKILCVRADEPVSFTAQALHGLRACLLAAGQHQEAKDIEGPLAVAQRYSEVLIPAACFCANRKKCT